MLDKPFKRLTKQQCVDYLEEHVFTNVVFLEHANKVCLILDCEKEVVLKVLKHFITYVFMEMNKIENNYVRRINLISFFKIIIKPGNRY